MKRIVFYGHCLILMSFLISCENSKESSTNEGSVWQVYEEWGEEVYVNSDTVVGIPSIPTVVYDGTSLPGATYTLDDLPDSVQCFIESGILSIDFPDILNLSEEYSSEYTGGVKIARVHIQKNSWQHIALHKLDEQHSGVIIYYTEKDIDCETGKGHKVQLKAGWNFWDKANDLISQDIHDFFKKGYRWRWESWD